ncbi:MAG: hypothetical protein WED04_03170 [Promethearchaeati archaeon SRVP18_Atabeyarchaeia-1]
MPKCPVCGASISSNERGFRGRGTFECPECKTKLKLSSSVHTVIYTTLLLATIATIIILVQTSGGLTGTHQYTVNGEIAGALGFPGSFLLIFFAPSMYWLEKAPLKIVERRPRCSHCNTIITQQNPEFCPKCGERLTTEDLKGTLPRRTPKG